MQMSGKKKKLYNDYDLCRDIAEATLSVKEIAKKHNLSPRTVYAIAEGRRRPGLKERTQQMIEAKQAEARRIFKSRGRWLASRLLEVAKLDTDIGLKAIIEGLRQAGLTVDAAEQTEQVREIRLVLTGETPLKTDLTGVVNGNGRITGSGELN